MNSWWHWLAVLMMAASNVSISLASAEQEFRSFFRSSRAPELRTMRAFAEAEIVLPNGPAEGLRFNCTRQPWNGAYFDAIDSGLYMEHVLAAPTQAGKSLIGFVIPSTYHLFEIEETIVCGLPSMDMAGDKWREDFLPVIERTRYREFLPRGGRGTKGNQSSITFRNGPTLRFMSGGGDDKSRAAFTARVIVITEADGLDTSAKTSQEASKIKQIEARSLAFNNRRRIYKECTVTVESGHIWTRYTAGTQSELVLPCPHCRKFVLPEREDLHGWQDASDEIAARESTHFHCPACGEAWTDGDRRQANAQAKLIHRGQTIDTEGVIRGDHPPTKVLGFRATAAHNMFYDTAELAAKEWQAAHDENGENAEKEQMQFVFVRPYQSPDIEVDTISATVIRDCVSDAKRAMIPLDAKTVTLGTDMGKWKSHWFLTAFRPGCSPHVVDVGVIQMATAELGIEKAIRKALDDVKEFALAGWQREGSSEIVTPKMVFIDSRFMPDEVCAWVQSCGRRAMFFPTMGHGIGYHRSSTYQQPKQIGGDVKFIGEQYHISYNPARKVHIVHTNADAWKEWLHQRITTPASTDGTPVPGRFTIFSTRGQDKDLQDLTKHLTSEHREQRFVPGKGLQAKWVADHSNNHWLDAASLSCVAGHYCGERLIGPTHVPPASTTSPSNQQPRMQTPDGRPFLITER